MKNIVKGLVLTIAILGVGCTEPGETTGVAAATGGVIGAGLGAIVGSQTGSAGGGLAIGAAAGAAGGALLGNALEAQEQGIRAQDEAIERQERTIAAQRAELEELRRMGQDNVGFKNRLKTSMDQSSPRLPNQQVARVGTTTNANSYAVPSGSPKEKDLPIPVAQGAYGSAQAPVSNTSTGKSYSDSLYGSYAWQNKAGNSAGSTAQVEAVKPTSLNANVSTECRQAEEETSKAKVAAEMADKLFHYRRAIRLCPTKPEYHNGLGEVYLALNRRDDAQFEFKEALNIDPAYEIARNNLSAVKGTPSRY